MRAVAGAYMIFDRMGLIERMKALDVGAGPGRRAMLGEIRITIKRWQKSTKRSKPAGYSPLPKRAQRRNHENS
jgi:hypothetical protein